MNSELRNRRSAGIETKTVARGSLATAIGRFAFVCCASLTSLNAFAQPVLITSPATINPSDGFITPTAGGPAVPLATADITVRGTTLTVNGRHTIRNLFVESNGTVTHAASFTFDYSGGAGTDVVNGMWLNVQANPSGGNVSIDATSRIDVTSKGFGPALGPGAGASTGVASTYASGASHGGSGVASAAGPSGSVYGSHTMPITFGSGGGSNPANGAVGGPGGGVVRLNVDGTLTVNGLLHANGAIGVNNAGSGAGGTIVIDAGTLSGNGQIWARGGDSWFGDRPAGGGGRIAFLRSSSGFTGSILANGGSGNTNGGPGTVYYEAATPRPRLVYRSVSPGETLLSEELAFDGDLFVQESTTLSHPAGIMPGLSVIVTGDLSIDVTSRIDASGKGFGSGEGPGAGTASWTGPMYASAGSHGGSGVSSTAGPAGVIYGSATMPTTFGSGGGANPFSSNALGGAGGGVVRLLVGGTLSVTGRIYANGSVGVNNAGSGAGGSIVIDAGTLSGNGQIWARGGDSWFGDRPAGGGGRIAFLRSTSGFTGSILANGGSGSTNGGPGTVYYEAATPRPRLVYKSVSPGTNTFAEPFEFDGDVLLQEGTIFTHPAGVLPGLSVSVTGDLSIDVTSRIDVSGMGFASGEGPGAGIPSWDASTYASAGSHGGSGVSSTAGPAGVIYGSATMPTTFGSGGGANPFNSNALGGAGGGMVRLLVGGRLSVTGRIYANGAIGVNNTGSGAGGSIVIDAGTLSGNGQIWARGGDAWFGDRPAGGGGRIAFLRSTSGFTGSILANGGTGSKSGGPGTVYYEAATPRPRLVYRSVSPGTNTYDEPFEFDGDVLLQEGTVFTHPAGVLPGLRIDVSGDLNIDVTSSLDVTGRGFAAVQGPGAGVSTGDPNTYASGGGHGGRGANTAAGPGGATYGSAQVPVTFGSGGGSNTGQSTSGGAGGGAMHVVVGGGDRLVDVGCGASALGIGVVVYAPEACRPRPAIPLDLACARGEEAIARTRARRAPGDRWGDAWARSLRRRRHR